MSFNNNLSTAGRGVCIYTYQDLDKCRCDRCVTNSRFLDLEKRIHDLEMIIKNLMKKEDE